MCTDWKTFLSVSLVACPGVGVGCDLPVCSDLFPQQAQSSSTRLPMETFNFEMVDFLLAIVFLRELIEFWRDCFAGACPPCSSRSLSALSRCPSAVPSP